MNNLDKIGPCNQRLKNNLLTMKNKHKVDYFIFAGPEKEAGMAFCI